MGLDDQNTGPFFIGNRVAAVGAEQVTAEVRIVTDGYFETMKIPSKTGRFFEPTDRADGKRVVVIDETLARTYFGSLDPIGAHIRLGNDASPSREIVGVVGPVLDEGLDHAARPTIYIPYAQAPAQRMSLALRTSVPPSSILPSVKRAIWSVDPAQPLFNVRRMDDIVSNTMSAPRLAFVLLAVFAAIALALAAVGMYGVTSYAGQQRTREIGMRVAMGASRHDILWMLIGAGLRHAGVGLAIGLSAAAAVSRLLATLLYGVTPFDATTLAGVAAMFVLVACAANAVPAWRAATANPVDALAGR